MIVIDEKFKVEADKYQHPRPDDQHQALCVAEVNDQNY